MGNLNIGEVAAKNATPVTSRDEPEPKPKPKRRPGRPKGSTKPGERWADTHTARTMHVQNDVYDRYLEEREISGMSGTAIVSKALDQYLTKCEKTRSKEER